MSLWSPLPFRSAASAPAGCGGGHDAPDRAIRAGFPQPAPSPRAGPVAAGRQEVSLLAGQLRFRHEFVDASCSNPVDCRSGRPLPGPGREVLEVHRNQRLDGTRRETFRAARPYYTGVERPIPASATRLRMSISSNPPASRLAGRLAGLVSAPRVAMSQAATLSPTPSSSPGPRCSASGPPRQAGCCRRRSAARPSSTSACASSRRWAARVDDAAYAGTAGRAPCLGLLHERRPHAAGAAGDGWPWPASSTCGCAARRRSPSCRH